ncbi:hypothetical protein LIER_36061 [Lithospermum erythrorhizon]|uniref:Uncharacterized protein n=1 Tax=Lithospermum erythrorhizon TaxID=34254 RepID=A0AAV3P473_LITER
MPQPTQPSYLAPSSSLTETSTSNSCKVVRQQHVWQEIKNKRSDVVKEVGKVKDIVVQNKFQSLKEHNRDMQITNAMEGSENAILDRDKGQAVIFVGESSEICVSVNKTKRLVEAVKSQGLDYGQDLCEKLKSEGLLAEASQGGIIVAKADLLGGKHGGKVAIDEV